jgi:hypothetical protein
MSAQIDLEEELAVNEPARDKEKVHRPVAGAVSG